MTALFASGSFEDEVLVGLLWRRTFELYLDASAASASCSAPSLGAGVDQTRWPLILVYAETPGGQTFRGTFVRHRLTAPAMFTVEIPRTAPIAARDEGESYLKLSIAMGDNAGNEIPIVEDGRIRCIDGALP